MNPNPTCDKDCRFTHGMSMSTCVYYPPVYDKHGNNLNPDMNSTSGTIDCNVCNQQWAYNTCNGKTTYSQV